MREHMIGCQRATCLVSLLLKDPRIEGGSSELNATPLAVWAPGQCAQHAQSQHTTQHLHFEICNHQAAENYVFQETSY